MIQRIQSLFLLVSAGGFGSQFVLPYLNAAEGNAARTLAPLSDGVLTPSDNPGLMGLAGLGALLALVSIFLYTRRSLQTSLARVGIAVAALLAALVALVVYQTMQALPTGGAVSYGVGLAMPIISAINQWLAARNIQKDETLVKSMDRLR